MAGREDDDDDDDDSGGHETTKLDGSDELVGETPVPRAVLLVANGGGVAVAASLDDVVRPAPAGDEESDTVTALAVAVQLQVVAVEADCGAAETRLVVCVLGPAEMEEEGVGEGEPVVHEAATEV